MKNKKALYVTHSAVIAALYIVLGYVSDFFGLSFGAVQLRLSEVLTVLPVLTPAAIPGLSLGCAIVNIASPFGLADVICGTAATLVSAVVTYLFKSIKFKGIPVFSLLSPVFFNAVVIGIQISVLNSGGFAMFLLTFLQIAVGQGVMCFVFGVPFLKAVQKTKIFNTSAGSVKLK